MRAQSDSPWWGLAPVLGLVPVVAAGALVVVRQGDLPDEFYILLFPAVVIAAPLIQVLADWKIGGPAHRSAGVLDRLVTRRRANELPPAGRVSARRPGRWPGRGPAEPSDESEALDRLVRRKREWAGPGDLPAS